MIILVFVNFVSHKPTHRPKIRKELPPLPPKKEKILKIFFQRFKNNKKSNAQPKLNDTKTQQRQWFTITVDKNASW